MSTFILLPGAWHTSRCWKRVSPILEAADHLVLTPDLRGVGDGSLASSASLASWTDQITGLVEQQPEAVLLVAHSRSGIVASMIAERVPDRIRQLIYVSGSLMPDGGSIATHGPQQEKDAPSSLQFQEDGSAVLPDDVARYLFLNRTPADWAEVALRELVAEPMWTFAEPVAITPGRFGQVSRAYVETLDDHALPLDVQRAMQVELPCHPVFTIDTDHSSFYSAPAQLGKALLEIASGF